MSTGDRNTGHHRNIGHRGMGRGPRGMLSSGDKAQNFKGTMVKLIQHLSKYWASLIVVFVFTIISEFFTIIGPKVLGKATTKLFEGALAKIAGTGGIDFGYVAQIIKILAGLYLLSAFFGYLQGWIMSGISNKVGYNFRKSISQKINKLPLKYFDKVSQGEIMSRISNDVDTLSQTLNQSLGQIITSITTVTGILIVMLTISWQMTLIALGIIPLSLVFIRIIVGRSQKYFKFQQDFLGNINGHVEEIYGGHMVMKAFNGEEQSMNKFNVVNEKLYKVGWKSQFLSSIMMPLMRFIGNLGYVAVCVMGGYFAVRKVIEVGDVQAFIQYVRHFTQPISQIANISNILQQTAASAERVFEFLSEEEETADSANPVKSINNEGQVEFKNVKFGYNPDKIVINNFTVSIKPGQRIAIVGPTGAGKTTIVKLLMRFYDTNEGTILIDGHDIKKFARHDLRSMFGMVLQDVWLYNDSIMENIRYGRLDATDEEVIDAAKAAHVHGFVCTLPNGYNMVLNEDVTNVSQGQKQLITIARAILQDPKILILDEATSSVDTLTEIRIRKAMDNLMKDRTSFVIAHRLSTIRDADLILVMNHGDIVEQGNHYELLEKGGFYDNLYNSQFEIPKAI